MKPHEVSAQAARQPMKRRSFLSLAAGALVAWGAQLQGKESLAQQAHAVAKLDEEELRTLLRGRLISSSPAMFDFAENVFATCVLGKIRPADAPLAHAWIVPGGGYYAQWLWDTMFVVDLLSILPNQAKVIRGVFQNYWDFQARWDAVKPETQHGMIANFMAPYDAPGSRDGKQWKTSPRYSQAPLLAWGMERVYLRNGDKQLLHEGLKPLESFHDWYWRERDVTDAGMIGVGSYSGDAQDARYETYDREVDLDDLQMTAHPGRAQGAANGRWYGDILIPANTAYLLLSELCLERLARVVGDEAMAKRRRERYEKGAAATRKHMWSEEHGCFLAVHRDTLATITTPTVGGFMPLMAGVPTRVQAARMARSLATRAWSTPLPIPTVARTSARFSSSEFWRGDVWPAPNYQVATGLASYGEHAAARRIADLTVANAMRVGISERYDSLTGAPLGVAGLGMSATALSMSLDGLTSPMYATRVRSRAEEKAK